MTRPLAVLRPEPGNAATAGRIEARGREAIRLPLFALRALDWTPPDPAGHDALLLTSANAPRFAGPDLGRLRQLPVFAVGERTAEISRAAGFDVMATGTAGAAEMIALLEHHGKSRALHLAGLHRMVDAGGPVSRVIPVYASEVLPLSTAALAALSGSVALLHSARAARRLGALLAEQHIARATIAIAALSPAVATTAGPGWAEVITAATPTDDALIDAACARD